MGPKSCQNLWGLSCSCLKCVAKGFDNLGLVFGNEVLMSKFCKGLCSGL